MLLLVSATIFAGGNPEVGLPKVDRLIKEKNYNDAILELTNYMNENPEDFDGAQQRLRKIIKMRESYNDTALDLLTVLADEPTNDKKKLDMIAYLEALEKNPNASTQNFIAETKAAAQFTYYRARFDEIMTTGDGQIDAGQYVAAAKTFQEGFAIYKAEFDETSSPEAVTAVNDRLTELGANIAQYDALQAAFVASVNSFRSAVQSRDPAAVEERYAALDAQLGSLATVRNAIAASGWYFEDSFAELQRQNKLLTENSFLPFAYRFTLGRKTSERFEGILGACDAQWNLSMDALENAEREAERSLWTESLATLGTGSAERALSDLASARRLLAVSERLAASLSRFTARADAWGKRDYLAFAASSRATSTVLAGLETLGARYGEYRAISAELAAYAPPPISPDAVRKAPAPAVTTWASWVSSLANLSAAVASDQTDRAPSGAPAEYDAEFSAWKKAFASSIAADTYAARERSAAYQADSAEAVVADRRSAYDEALALLDGKPNDAGSVSYYPSQSLTAFTDVRSGIASDKRALGAAADSLRKASTDVLARPQYAASLARIDAANESLDRISANAGTGITRANSRILQSNLARQESDLRFTQAQAALRRNDFQAARDNLQRSRDRINVALSLQEDVALRKSSDQKLEALGADITRIENESVVREVRALISSGKNAYYLGNFDQADQIFTQAKTRWSATNVDENAEVANWLTIVNTALSMKTGRTIPVSAPLYPQMSQILNTANQLFSEGKQLIGAGQRTAAISRLEDAKSKLQQLQLVYPLNQDAGLMTLKIDQLIDPIAFSVFFRQKVDSVRQNYKVERQTSYSDLLDLYQINPDYPGIKKLLDDVEIYLGVKLPPPDPKALARSSELTRSAQKIYDANTRSMFQVALDQLDEAVKLNPDNQVAIALKDRVQTSVGGQSVAVLSATDEAKYQQAVQELQRGNKITASALVEQLLQNPKSRNSAKILDLKKRIDSQL